jgi:hypothetical protein
MQDDVVEVRPVTACLLLVGTPFLFFVLCFVFTMLCSLFAKISVDLGTHTWADWDNTGLGIVMCCSGPAALGITARVIYLIHRAFVNNGKRKRKPKHYD